MIELEKICSSNIKNSPLRTLVEQLQGGYRSDVELLRITPDTAQKIPSQWHHHTDHSDYTENKHTDSAQPQHSDYCD